MPSSAVRVPRAPSIDWMSVSCDASDCSYLMQGERERERDVRASLVCETTFGSSALLFA